MAKQLRVTVRKQQHRNLLSQIAQELGGDEGDALEHILNCWVLGGHSAPSTQHSTPPQVIAPTVDADEFDGLIDYGD